MNKIYDAIILSTTYGENENEIINFLEHLCLRCKEVKDLYKVIAVIVFEKVEIRKSNTIRKYFEKNGLKKYLKVFVNRSSTGFPACLNYGISKTQSNFIIRIDTDDRLHSENKNPNKRNVSK